MSFPLKPHLSSFSFYISSFLFVPAGCPSTPVILYITSGMYVFISQSVVCTILSQHVVSPFVDHVVSVIVCFCHPS